MARHRHLLHNVSSHYVSSSYGLCVVQNNRQFRSFPYPTSSDRPHAGMCAYFPTNSNPSISYSLASNTEYLQIQIDGKLQLFIHRRNANPLRDFNNSLNNIITSFNPDIIVGDFNINIFSTSNNIVHIMNQQGYIRCPMSREFTTVKFTAIDVAFAKNNVNVDVLESYFSDHFPLIYNF